MLVSQLLPFAKNLSTRKWTDEDIPEDIQYIRDELSTRFESLTFVCGFYVLDSSAADHELQNIRRVPLGTPVRSPFMDACPRIRPFLEGERDEAQR